MVVGFLGGLVDGQAGLCMGGCMGGWVVHGWMHVGGCLKCGVIYNRLYVKMQFQHSGFGAWTST